MTSRWTLFAAPLIFAGAAAAATIQIAVDEDPSGLVPGPNSSALATAFRGGLPVSRTIDFESLLPQFTTNFSPLSGVTITLQNVSPFADTISSSSDQFSGFNTTPAGSNFLQLDNDDDLDPPQTVVARFQFGAPVTAFGFYLTGAGTGLGSVLLDFMDGVTPHTEVLSFTDQYLSSSVIYVAISNLGAPIQEFRLSIEADGDQLNEIVGVDDITFVETVPEPSTIALAAAGALVLLLRRK